MRVGRADVEPTPDVFAAVMATGILSIAARDHGYGRISDTLGVVATAGLVFLVVLVVATTLGGRRRSRWDLTDPDVTLRLFTFVAACAVIDTRLQSNVWALRALGAVALCSWLVLIGLSSRNVVSRRWATLRSHAHGAWELGSVGTSGLAIVIARAAYHTGHRWWLAPAVAVWVSALLIYALTTWLILWRVVSERRYREGGWSRTAGS